ncbi:DUF4442 domain-containing protein [Zhouia spongiae]|uniref:DUF4442 domain-containing protein n=1 Tax=Zhouia spongiae TaxID=2202721 RepID=A0ABY3YM63_9FLAO|nr:DUF4442 domain-containing protein [Zhouia spongiae]UNY98713.1 DUF4442 domain-containing protein [Zhouia spongiae]
MTPQKLNTFTLLKLPSAWLCGVRVKEIDNSQCLVKVKHGWINQNPFKSMFWAVQGMAAEMTTGVLVMKQIKESGRSVSMLVLNMNANFSKKAVGKVNFVCKDGHLVGSAIQQAIATGKGQTIWMKSVGVDEKGDVVSTFNFEWTLKVKG